MADEQQTTIDAVTGTATTGHEWDGIRELNTPLPRWWLWLFYITHRLGDRLLDRLSGLAAADRRRRKGVLGWHSRSAIVDRSRRSSRPQRGPMMDKLTTASLDEIAADPQLLDFARAQGRAAFADNCAPCHGAGGGGAKGYPNLNDDDWLWGGKLDDIEQTIRHGVRVAGDDDGRQGNMPAFGRDGMLKPNEISAVADYVRSLSGLAAGGRRRSRARQEGVRRQLRRSATATDGKGNRELGAPNLTDKIWLYGSDKKTIVRGPAERPRRRDAGLGRRA